MRSPILKIPPLKKPPLTQSILPAEHTPHTRTLMAFPTFPSLHPDQLPGARSEILNIAHAISRFEPVTIFVHPDDSLTLRTKLQEREKEIKLRNIYNVEMKEISLESLWLRDTGPVFILHDDNDAADTTKERESGIMKVRGIDFNFNSWGNKLPPGADVGLSARILQLSNTPRVKAGIVAEGGGIETDGEGTLLVCASSVVNENRNPGMGREDAERELRGVLGVEKVVWLEGVRGEDITDCHVDALARFVRPGMVVMSRPRLDRNGEKYGVWWRVYEDAKRVLGRERDAKGRRFEVVEIEEPDLEFVEQETNMLEDDEFSNVFSYVNYVLVNGGVVAPKFGDEKADSKCKEFLQDGSGYHRGNEPVTPGINGAAVTQVASPVQWNPLGVPIENASQNIIDHQDSYAINGDISASSVPGTQVITNTFPTNIPNFTDAEMAVGYPNVWDGTGMYLNTPLMNCPQLANNGFPSMATYPSWAVSPHPFNLGISILPTIQAPRASTFCTLCPASFTRPSDFQRHHESVHLGIKYHCFWIGCSNNRGNGYCRAEKLRTHQRKVHGLA
ncbi:hypothetical protein IFR05_015801 [Cadophora sp. M221]|nr:hypothetical protein IFR05_015801 [Cadophora sp. M221]